MSLASFRSVHTFTYKINSYRFTNVDEMSLIFVQIFTVAYAGSLDVTNNELCNGKLIRHLSKPLNGLILLKTDL